METDYKKLFETLISRYSGTDADALLHVICPVLIPIHSIDKTIIRLEGQTHYRASFSVKLDEHNQELLVRGRTGKFVPKLYTLGEGVWKEIAKGRFTEIDYENGVAHGEIYISGNKAKLENALAELSQGDYLEIDQYGAAAKVLSGLVEYSLSRIANTSCELQ